ncbi:hypothetical protein ACYF6T_13660 [Streptomyces sp. 7R007]
MYTPFDHPTPRRVQPGEHPAWEEALALVNRDVAATLPDHGPLRLLALPGWEEEDEVEHVYVALPNGHWWGNNVWGSGAADTALAAVAEAAQDTLTECLWRAWPVCEEHGLGMHLDHRDDTVVWVCAGSGTGGDPGHVRAAVGALDTVHGTHRARRERRS